MFINKLKLFRISYIISFILLAVFLFIQLVLPSFGINISLNMTRNFAGFGMPLFMIGHFFGKNKDKIKNINLSEKQLCLFITSGFILTLIEKYFALIEFPELFIGSVIIMLSLMIYAIKMPSNLEGSRLEYTGMKYSLFIYLYHNIAIDILTDITTALSLDNIDFILYILPVLAFLLTTSAAAAFYKMCDLRKKSKSI